MRAYAMAFLSCTATLAQSSSLPPGTVSPEETQTVTVQLAHNALAAAEIKLDTHDYAGARPLLEQYLKSYATDARALYDLGYAQDAQGQGDAAEASYRKAVAADPKQFDARAALGLLLANMGRKPDAITELKTAGKLTPDPPNLPAQAQANRALARLLEATEPEGARTALLAALRESPETPADTLMAAELAAKLGEVDASADAYGKVLAGAAAGSPEQVEASAGLAHLLIAAKRYQAAEPVLRKALQADPQSPALNSQLAVVLNEEGKPADAIAVLETLHATKPGDAAVSGMLADLYLQTGAPAKADPLYEQALAAQPHDPSLLAARGDALIRARKFDEALPLLKEATERDPSNGNAWTGLAFAANQLHQPQLVLDALAMRKKVMSETAPTYFLEATACDTLGETKHAVELYRQFLSVAGTGYPDEVWQARHRLIALAK